MSMQCERTGSTARRVAQPTNLHNNDGPTSPIREGRFVKHRDEGERKGAQTRCWPRGRARGAEWNCAQENAAAARTGADELALQKPSRVKSDEA